MDNSNTLIIKFADNDKSVFTMRKDKTYNMKMYDKYSVFGKHKYCIKITNGVSLEIFDVFYYDKKSRDDDYTSVIEGYKKLNGME